MPIFIELFCLLYAGLDTEVLWFTYSYVQYILLVLRDYVFYSPSMNSNLFGANSKNFEVVITIILVYGVILISAVNALTRIYKFSATFNYILSKINIVVFDIAIVSISSYLLYSFSCNGYIIETNSEVYFPGSYTIRCDDKMDYLLLFWSKTIAYFSLCGVRSERN